MQKFGEGNVEHVAEDPQGVQVDPAAEGLQREGAAQPTPEETQQALQEENDQADAAPGVYPGDEN